LTRPDPSVHAALGNHPTAAAAAAAAAAETSLLLVIGCVAGHSAAGRRRLHQILIGAGSILVEEAVEGLLVYPGLGELNLVKRNYLQL
jgi:hypothetical protein